MDTTRELPTAIVATGQHPPTPAPDASVHLVGSGGPEQGHEHRTDSAPLARPALDRHRRKCTICNHPDRELIEREFLRWSEAWFIQETFELQDVSCLYRHALATGLYEQRRRNVGGIAEAICEHAASIKPSGNTVMQALRALTQITPDGKWIEPPKQYVITNIFQTVPANPSAGSNIISPATAPEARVTAPPALPGAGKLKTLDIPAELVRAKNSRIARGTARSQKRLARQLNEAHERMEASPRRVARLSKQLKTKAG